MRCPLCGDTTAFVIAEEFDLLVACQPCGGPFLIAHVAFEHWHGLDIATGTVALKFARSRLAELRRFPRMPQLKVYDVWAWSSID